MGIRRHNFDYRKMRPLIKQDLISLLLIIVTGFFLFSSIFENSLSLDVYHFFEKSKGASLIDIPKLIDATSVKRSPELPLWWVPKEMLYRMFRPLSALFAALEFRWWHLNTWPYHLLNLSFHILCSVAVYFIARILLKNKLVALICGLVFCIHPCNARTIVYSGIDTIFCLFYLLSFLALLTSRDSLDRRKKRVFLVASIVLFIFSILAKETAVTLPFVVLFYGLIFCTKPMRQHLKKDVITFLPFFIILFAYLVYYFTVFSDPNHLPSGYYHSPFKPGSAASILNNYLYYFSSLVFLRPLIGFSGAFYFIVVIIALIILLRERSKALFFFCWVFLNITPAVIVTGDSMRLYLSSAGFALLTGLIIFEVSKAQKLFKQKAVITSALVSVLLIGGYLFFTSSYLRLENSRMRAMNRMFSDFEAQYPSFPDNSKLYFINVWSPDLCFLSSKIRLEYSNPTLSVYVLTIHWVDKDSRDVYITKVNNKSFAVGLNKETYFNTYWEKIFAFGRASFVEGQKERMDNFEVVISKVSPDGLKEIRIEMKDEINNPRVFIFECRGLQIIPVVF